MPQFKHLVFRLKCNKNLPETQFHNPHFVRVCVLHSTTRVSLRTKTVRSLLDLSVRLYVSPSVCPFVRRDKIKYFFFFLLYARHKEMKQQQRQQQQVLIMKLKVLLCDAGAVRCCMTCMLSRARSLVQHLSWDWTVMQQTFVTWTSDEIIIHI